MIDGSHSLYRTQEHQPTTVGQLAPRNVPQPQESQPDVPQEASAEEEPFEIELVVPESTTAQDSPAEEQQ
jgi:hypothetical protein